MPRSGKSNTGPGQQREAKHVVRVRQTLTAFVTIDVVPYPGPFSNRSDSSVTAPSDTRPTNRDQPTADSEPASRTTRLLDLVAPIGNLLVAQLLFFCCALTIVLVVPAAVALQRTVHAVLTEQENAVARTFVRELPPAVRRFWAVGLAVDLLAVMITVSLFFWGSSSGPVALAGLVCLAVLGGLLLGGYLCALAESVPATPGIGGWLRASLARLQRQPLLVAGCVVIMITWFLLLARLPTLAVIGTGLIPALLAHWLRHRDPVLTVDGGRTAR
jgi:uncharacterized membrane protein YesL